MTQVTIRWQTYSDLTMYCEVNTAGHPVWSYLGSVVYFPGNWLTKWLYPKRFAAMTMQGAESMFKTLSEAQEFVEDNAVWP